jgi:hypothetical protein
MQIAGMLGFDMLHSFVLHLDYRDGLVKMESAELENGTGGAKGTFTASSKPACEPGDVRDRPNRPLRPKSPDYLIPRI